MALILAGVVALLLIIVYIVGRELGYREAERDRLAVCLNLTATVGGLTLHSAYGSLRMSDLTLDQNVTLTIAPTDAKDRPAEVASVVWNASAPGLVVAADNLSAVFTPQADGDVTVTVTATDVEGNALPPETAALSVKKGLAVKLNLTVGAPQPIPAP